MPSGESEYIQNPSEEKKVCSRAMSELYSLDIQGHLLRFDIWTPKTYRSNTVHLRRYDWMSRDCCCCCCWLLLLLLLSFLLLQAPKKPTTPPPGPGPRGTPPEKVMDFILTSSLETSKSRETHAETHEFNRERVGYRDFNEFQRETGMVVLLYDP